MKQLGVICLVVAALAGSVLGRADSTPSATQLAGYIDKAAGTVSYAAVRRVTFRTANGVRTFDERILRASGKMYLSYSSDSDYGDQQIYEIGTKRYTYNKTSKEMRVAPVRGGYREVVELLKKADKEKRLDVVKGDAIAGRETFYVEIPSSRGRGASHRIWVDKTKYVVLKRSFGMRSDDETGGFEYSVIDYSRKIPSYKFNLPKGAKLITVQDDVRRLAKELGLKAMMVSSPGKLELVSAGQMDFRGSKILRQFYSDGEKRLSLFVMKQTSDKVEFRGDRVQSYQWNSGGMTLVLIGDFTESELKRLAQSVKT